MVASLLLAYPDGDVLAALPTVRAATPSLPPSVRERLDAFCDLLATLGDGRDLRDLQARYVATFDLKRRCAMYLSYYAAGDTRRRGTALVAFVEAYRAAGWEITESELPDYLPTVLEFSARTQCEDAAIAAGLLASHRDGIEVLRAALEQQASPWTGLVEAVCLTLPPLDERTQQRYVELVTSGPPAELVGMEPFALEPYGRSTEGREVAR
jgi:nitrate reductase delta subunit